MQNHNNNLDGEVEYLTASGTYARVLIAVVTPVPGTEVGKITGFDSGLHFNLPGFRLQQSNFKPWPRSCPDSRTVQRLSISPRSPKSPWHDGYSSHKLDPRLGRVLAYERFGSRVTWQVAS